MQNWPDFNQRLSDNHHRTLVVISGPLDWGLAQLSQFFTPTHTTLWLGDHAIDGSTAVKAKQAQQWLGQQCQQLVINGHHDIDFNALGALAGTVTAGNCAYLLCPALQGWTQHSGGQRLVQHLINTIAKNSQLVLVQPQQPIQWPTLDLQPLSNFDHPSCKTEEQQHAVAKILKVVSGHRRRPLVLTADRGRGKSSALGLAVVELIQAGKQKLLISAPQKSSTAAVFERVAEQLGAAQDQLQFIAIDELLRSKPKADLVMIDEAAAIPAPLLTQLLKHYSRLVFTTTIAGYEGTGRSFEIRFKHSLETLCPGWQQYHIQQPIRFANNDPLEG
jgi:tRNA(Met) cytidine acetyltransferase